MSIFSGLFRSRDKPSNKIGGGWSFLFGGTSSGKAVTSFVFRETLMSHLLLWGNAYAQIIRDGRCFPIALYPLLPDRMSVDRKANMTKSMAQTVYPASRRNYTISAQIGSDNLSKGANGQVGIEVVFEYEDGTTETRFIDLY